MDEQLKRIADALENIAQELGSVNVHLESLDELSGCIDKTLYGSKGIFCVKGGISVYTD